MRIEAVTVSVGYADFLFHTLAENLQHVDHMVVVTSHEDKATADVCNFFGVVCVQSDVHSEYADRFNKGRMANVGVSHCRNDGWLLLLDADVALPHRFRGTLNMAKPEAGKLYGADRLNVHGFDDWKRIRDEIVPQFINSCHVVPHPDLVVGARLLHGDYGYCPIGYFQLWHSGDKRLYPGNTGSAEHSDVVFAIQWPRTKRVLLPQMFVHHLDSAPGLAMGTNWAGRKSPAFCPCHDYFLPEHLKYGKNLVADEHHRRHHPHHHHPPYWRSK